MVLLSAPALIEQNGRLGYWFHFKTRNSFRYCTSNIGPRPAARVRSLRFRTAQRRSPGRNGPPLMPRFANFSRPLCSASVNFRPAARNIRSERFVLALLLRGSRQLPTHDRHSQHYGTSLGRRHRRQDQGESLLRNPFYARIATDNPFWVATPYLRECLPCSGWRHKNESSRKRKYNSKCVPGPACEGGYLRLGS